MKEWLQFLGLKNFILTKIAFIFPEELYIHEQSQVLKAGLLAQNENCRMKEPLIVPGKESSLISLSTVGV